MSKDKDAKKETKSAHQIALKKKKQLKTEQKVPG